MKTALTPLGFDTSQLISFITKDGISKGDHVMILRPKESPNEQRGDTAFNETKEILNKISEDIKIKKIVLNTKNFEETVLEISNLIDQIEGEIVVNLSGGVRSIIVALTINSIFYHEKIDRVYNLEKIDRNMREIELPFISFELTDNEKKIFTTISKEGPLTYNELVDKLDLSKSTVSRLSKILEKKHIVTIEEKGKQKQVSLSLTGKLIST
ncbi:MAG: CRISPR-associated CARF protein Csa3 [Thermoplasmatota archaeon]